MLIGFRKRSLARMPSITRAFTARAVLALVALALLTPRPSSAAAPPAAVTSETVREMFEHAYVASRDTHGAHASR